MLQRSNEVMGEAIYETEDNVEGHDPESEKEDLKAERHLQAQHRGGDTGWSRCKTLTTVCVVPLCVLVVVFSTVLWIKIYIHTNLTKERHQLQTSYNNLSKEREQLQRDKDFCKCWWFSFSSSIYYISNERKSWKESRQYCRDKGADLMIMNSKEEQEFISKHISNSAGVWIGLSDRDKEGEWKWVDHSPLTFRNWGTREPGGKERENCGKIYKTSDRIIWNYLNCSGELNWICEKDFSP